MLGVRRDRGTVRSCPDEGQEELSAAPALYLPDDIGSGGVPLWITVHGTERFLCRGRFPVSLPGHARTVPGPALIDRDPGCRKGRFVKALVPQGTVPADTPGSEE